MSNVVRCDHCGKTATPDEAKPTYRIWFGWYTLSYEGWDDLHFCSMGCIRYWSKNPSNIVPWAKTAKDYPA